MASHYEIVKRWVLTNTTAPNTRKLRSRSNIFYEGRRIYSWGNHFEMARAILGKDGRTAFFLVNGDRFSQSTGQHQAEVRAGITRSGVPSVIIPFTALTAAGIDFDSIVPLDIQAERTETINHVTYEQPEGSRWVDVEITERRRKSDAALNAAIDERHAMAVEEWQRRAGYASDGDAYWVKWLIQYPQAPVRESLEHYVSHTSEFYLYENVVVATKATLQFTHRSWMPITVTTLADGRTRYAWETRRHWLGESLIRATMHGTKWDPCKACKGAGLLKGAPPKPVQPSWRAHQYVLTYEGSLAQNAMFEAEFAVWDQTWSCPTCHSHKGASRQVVRTAKFLSGFDRNERRASYFFCEMPRTAAVTVEDAITALKPDTVKLAEQMGRTVIRQGDIFAVELAGATKRSLRAMGATFTRRGTLFGTNHEATETAVLPNGTTLARGCLYHNPGARAADHARVSLGDGWKVIVKNTVPLTR